MEEMKRQQLYLHKPYLKSFTQNDVIKRQKKKKNRNCKSPWAFINNFTAS